MKRLRFLCLLGAAFWIATLSNLAAPAVQVTLKLDENQIAVGESTTLHVFAQIVEAQRASTDRIFSWYVDLLNSGGAVAKLNADSLVRTASDKDSRTSSAGSSEGANRRGIYDTFLNLAGAGKSAPVELFSIPVQGIGVGTASFHVQAGTGVSGLAADFIVAPTGGGDPLLGGDYSAASIQLEVTGGGTVCEARITKIAHSAQVGGGNQAVITFSLCPGKNLSVEFSDDLGGAWQALPGAPHNSGSVTDSSTSSHRFFRLRIGD
jgi:hypothetical protein